MRPGGGWGVIVAQIATSCGEGFMRNRRGELEGRSSCQPTVAAQSGNDDVAILRWYHALTPGTMLAMMR